MTWTTHNSARGGKGLQIPQSEPHAYSVAGSKFKPAFTGLKSCTLFKCIMLSSFKIFSFFLKNNKNDHLLLIAVLIKFKSKLLTKVLEF